MPAFIKHMKRIDTHCHFLTPAYVDALKKYDRINEDGFPIPAWSLDTQLEYMEKAGLSHAILSLSTPHQHFGDDAFSAELSRSINEYAAELKKNYPDKFSFAACLPLPNVELALAEARYSLDTLGACGVKMASQSNGLYLGNEALEPLMEFLNKKQTTIIIHPSKPQAIPQNCFTSGPLPLMEFINDTTRAVINLIANGTLEKFPNIKVLVPHCGSFLPNIMDRLTSITDFLASKGLGNKVNVEQSLRSLYFDLAGDAFPRGAAILSTLADEDHIVFGGDFPYTPISFIAKKVNDMEQYEPFAGCLDKISYKNAEKLFHLQ